jgi:hypothetical protein
MRRDVQGGSLSWKRFRLFGLVTLVFCCLYGYLVSLQFPTGQETHSDVKFFAPDQSALLLKTQARNSGTQATATSQTSVATVATSTVAAQASTAVTQASTGTASTAATVVAHPPASGEPMPVGDLPGWRLILAEDFNSNVPAGGFPGTPYRNQFTIYPDGTADTAGQNGGSSRYFPSKVVSVYNGFLNFHLHSENRTPMGAAVLPILSNNHLYGKYSIRFRSDAIQGFKFVSLLWPDSKVWPLDGEIDFPEGNLTEEFLGFVHHQGATVGNDQDSFTTGVDFSAWHTTSIEWTPGKVRLLLDGSVIGESTTRIPHTSMHWVLQAEACLTHCPGTYGSGYLQVDWLAAYSMV